jgi:hypothetical protein
MNAEERTEVLARSRGLRDSSGSAAGEPQLMAGQAARTAHAVDVYRSMTEAKIAAMLAELLGRTGIKRDTDIFSIGFHSLLALKFVARVKTALGVDAGSGRSPRRRIRHLYLERRGPAHAALLHA